MRLHAHYISFPPYICCSWSQICSITSSQHPEGYKAVTISLKSGEKVYLPELLPTEERDLFKAYMQYLKKSKKPSSKESQPESRPEPSQEAIKRLEMLNQLQRGKSGLSTQLRELLESSSSLSLSQLTDKAMARGTPLSDMIVFSTEQSPMQQSTTLLMRHDPLANNSAILPKELLRKIRCFSKKILSPKEFAPANESVPGCHCPFCQITRAIEEGLHSNELTLQEGEEIVSDKDLSFAKWRVLDLGNERFELTNPSDTSQRFVVEIKPEIKCSCGNKGCEHIVTILEKF